MFDLAESQFRIKSEPAQYFLFSTFPYWAVYNSWAVLSLRT